MATSVNLRPWTVEDTEQLVEWLRQDPDMIEQVGFGSIVEVINAVTQILQAPNALILAGENGTGELLGYVAAVNVSADGSAHVHIGVSPDKRGKGIALMREGLRYAFDELGLASLIAAVPPGRDDVEKFDRHFGFAEPNAKILVLTRGAWEERNGRSTG